MAFEQEQRSALHLLQSIENGTLSTLEVNHLIDEADPALVYFVFTWLRRHYAGDHPAAEGVIGRLVEITGKHRTANEKVQKGKTDPVVTWFEEEYSYRELDAEKFVALIVEKLEG